MDISNIDIPNLNINILKSNIDKLRKQHGITQNQLAEAIGTSQSNLSKALNSNYKQCVTFEQIYKIAKVFNVTIDSLISQSTSDFLDKPKLTKKDFANILISIFNSFEAQFVEYIRTEDHYEITSPKTYDELMNDFDNYDPITKDVSYDAIIFPKHWLIPKNEELIIIEDIVDIHSEASACGTELAENKILNEFISKFKTIHELYIGKRIPESAYKAALNQYLDEIK